MKNQLRWFGLALLLVLCLTLPALAEEAITVGGIEDGVATMNHGYLDLYISGGREHGLYRGTLAFTNLNGKQMELYFDYYADEGEYRYSASMAGKPGEYGPFTLTLTCGQEVLETQFMGRVPEDTELYVEEGWGQMDRDWQAERAFASLTLTPAHTRNITIVSPVDRSVIVGKAGYPIPWEAEFPDGKYEIELVDLTTGKTVGLQYYTLEYGEEGTFIMSDVIHPDITFGHMYQLSFTLGSEVAYTRFIAVDEEQWTGENPWDAVNGMPAFVEPADPVENYYNGLDPIPAM